MKYGQRREVPAWAYAGYGLNAAALLLVVSPKSSMATAFSQNSGLSTAYLLFSVVLVLATATTVFFRGMLSPTGCRPHTVAAIAAVQFAVGLLPVFAAAGLLDPPLLAVTLFVQAATYPYLSLAWTEAYAALPKRALLRRTGASLGVAALVVALAHLAPLPAGLALTCLLPLSSLLLIWIVLHARQYDSLPDPGVPAGDTAPGPSARFLAGTLCTLAAGNLLAGTVEQGGGFLLWPSLVAGNLAGALAAGTAALLDRRKDVDLKKFNLEVIGILAACYAATGIVLDAMGSPSDTALFVRNCIVGAAAQCASTSAWAVLVDAARNAGAGVLRTVGPGLVAIDVGKALGSTLGMLVPLSGSALAMVALGIFVAAAGLLASDLQASTVPTMDRESFSRQLDARLDEVAREYGLSPREREVFALWMAGYHLGYTADQLGVTVNTVKTHIAHIYRKTGTANREELLELVKTG